MIFLIVQIKHSLQVSLSRIEVFNSLLYLDLWVRLEPSLNPVRLTFVNNLCIEIVCCRLLQPRLLSYYLQTLPGGHSCWAVKAWSALRIMFFFLFPASVISASPALWHWRMYLPNEMLFLKCKCGCILKASYLSI